MVEVESRDMAEEETRRLKDVVDTQGNVMIVELVADMEQ